MLRLAYAVLLGLFGAGIVHIVALLMVPSFSERDAWSRLAETSGPYRMTRLDSAASGEPVDIPVSGPSGGTVLKIAGVI